MFQFTGEKIFGNFLDAGTKTFKFADTLLQSTNSRFITLFEEIQERLNQGKVAQLAVQNVDIRKNRNFVN